MEWKVGKVPVGLSRQIGEYPHRDRMEGGRDRVLEEGKLGRGITLEM